MEQRARRAYRHVPVCVANGADEPEQNLPHVIDIGTDLYLQLMLDLDRPVSYTPDEWARLVIESHVDKQRKRGAL